MRENFTCKRKWLQQRRTEEDIKKRKKEEDGIKKQLSGEAKKP